MVFSCKFSLKPIHWSMNRLKRKSISSISTGIPWLPSNGEQLAHFFFINKWVWVKIKTWATDFRWFYMFLVYLPSNYWGTQFSPKFWDSFFLACPRFSDGASNTFQEAADWELFPGSFFHPKLAGHVVLIHRGDLGNDAISFTIAVLNCFDSHPYGSFGTGYEMQESQYWSTLNIHLPGQSLKRPSKPMQGSWLMHWVVAGSMIFQQPSDNPHIIPISYPSWSSLQESH